ncbi:MAG: transcriptional regulator GcvA [Proteobacteria bacterium]|nr:transcriptional regulator GcvA [Pseudomonadota bacterium]
MRDLPPLNALRAFDAAARHLSLTRAASELHVTHGAVSRQVKDLEAFFGRQLFERRPRGLELTSEGRMLAFTAGKMFEDLRHTVRSLRDVRQPGIITVSTVPSLAARWLVPRLAAFQERWPGREIRVGTTKQLVNFSRDQVDVALRYGRGGWRGVHYERLFSPREFPVCAPALLSGEKSLRQPVDLQNFTLIHDMGFGNWAQWLAAAGAKQVDVPRGLVLQDMNVVLQAAIEGQGVALASLPLVYADLRAGRLVRPFTVDIPVELSFYIVCESGREHSPELQPFLEWLRREAAVVETDGGAAT